MDIIQAYTNIIKNNIDYDSLIMGCSPGDKEYVDEMVGLMAEVNHDLYGIP